jgi:NAD(P)H dehydrogenase (quinone)
MILITTAGKVGFEAARLLTQRDESVRVLVRNPEKATALRLGAALVGVDRLLLISSSEAGQRVAHHTNVIEAAKTAGTARIVYTSMLNSDDTTNPLAVEHQDS